MSKVSSLHHIVICTKYRTKTIHSGEAAHPLYKYIWGIVNARKCKLIRIGGIENHIHMLIDVHQEIALANLVRDIKRASSLWVHDHVSDYPLWEGWAEGYYAFSISFDAKPSVVKYINSQIEHHSNNSINNELETILNAHGMSSELCNPQGVAQ